VKDIEDKNEKKSTGSVGRLCVAAMMPEGALQGNAFWQTIRSVLNAGKTDESRRHRLLTTSFHTRAIQRSSGTNRTGMRFANHATTGRLL
jgi:hypothetical protein